MDADFVLTLRNPWGDVEHWDFGWNLQDLRVEAAAGRSLEEQFGSFIESLFDDHMSDLREADMKRTAASTTYPCGSRPPKRYSVSSASARCWAEQIH